MPLEWDVDLVSSAQSVRDWLEDHPNVGKMQRVIKYPNPAMDLDDERSRMRALGAERKEESWVPHRGAPLDLRNNQVFEEYLEGVDYGFVEIRLESREGAAGVARFSTEQSTDHFNIDPYRDDLAQGMQRVQEAVRVFSMLRAGESQPEEPVLDPEEP